MGGTSFDTLEEIADTAISGLALIGMQLSKLYGLAGEIIELGADKNDPEFSNTEKAITASVNFVGLIYQQFPEILNELCWNVHEMGKARGFEGPSPETFGIENPLDFGLRANR